MNAKHESIFRPIALIMAVTFGLTHLPVGPVAAEMIGTDRVVQTTQVDGARATIDEFLARDDIRAEFERQGVDPAEADKRIAALSDAEAVHLARTIESDPAGASALGVIVGAGILIFLVLLVTDLLGFTSVFGFTRKGSANPA